MLLTQTDWLRMPARELGSSFEVPNGAHVVGTTLFKRHKSLPHPQEDRLPYVYPSVPATRPQDLTVDTCVSSQPGSDTSSPHTLKHTSRRIGAPVLPPTPPTHSRQSSGTQSITISAPKYEDTAKSPTDLTSVPGTPPNQKSPPTPDFTPPRAMPLALRPRPPTNDRFPSTTSRTDSFKTARENQYSSDEDEILTVRPILPSARPSEVEVPKIPRRNEKRKEVGLGLGLESDAGTTTPKANTESQQEFVVFDGEWADIGEVSEVEREWDDNLMRNVTVRKRPVRNTYKLPDTPNGEVVEDDIISPTIATKVVRGLSLQERIARHRLERDAENFGDRMAWPTAVPNFDSPTIPDDIRRFSTMSGRSTNSTVIEAMVVNTLPARKRTLRHSKKQLGLRDFSDQSTITSGPSSSSVGLSEPRHVLVHKRSRIPEKRHRSLTSNGTVSTTSSSGASRRNIIRNGGIPVVVIPDRRSSTKSSKAPSLKSTSSRKTKRSMSLNSAPLSNSSKFNEPGYFDIKARKRTMSESDGSGHSVRTIDFPPNIPARRSSLSAPTSRNTSRAGSLTAESLKAHDMIQKPLVKPEPERHISSESQKELGHTSFLNVDHNGDPFFGKRLSTQVTPFSQSSYETAGTAAEVSEAMAVSIFPHQNKSLLVVQQTAPQPSPPKLKDIVTSQPELTLNGESEKLPATPPQPVHPMDKVDSPLRNPRAPPEPPAIKFIPPTPSGLTPSQEEDRQLGYEPPPVTSDEKPKRRLSLMRRAFSNRRNSESLIQPESILKRTFSLTGRRREVVDDSTQTSKGNANPSTLYPSVADRPADGSKLHPFWRPTHFWDDLENHDSDDEWDHYPVIDNRPPPPKRSLSSKLKRTFAILPIKDDYDYATDPRDRRIVRRTPSGNMRVVKQRSKSNLSREESVRRKYEEVDQGDEGTFGYGFPPGNGGRRFHTIPGLGIRVEYVGWSGMKRRLSERRREQRSEKLRASISQPRGVQNGTDDVLRRRSET